MLCDMTKKKTARVELTVRNWRGDFRIPARPCPVWTSPESRKFAQPGCSWSQGINPIGGNPDPAPRRACLLSLGAWQVDICKMAPKPTRPDADKHRPTGASCSCSMHVWGSLGEGPARPPGGFFPTPAAGEGGRADPPCLLLRGWCEWCLHIRRLCAQGCGVQPVPSACAVVLAAILLPPWYSMYAWLAMGIDACFCTS